MATITVGGDQGWTQYYQNGGNADIIDASDASWNANNEGSPEQAYPVRVRNWQNRVEVRAGTINGSYSLTKEWGAMYYQGNGAAVFLQNCPSGSSVTGWRMDRVWDGIRVIDTDNYLVEDCHINICRDDAIEADQGRNGTVRNCLLENCFAGISFGDSNTPASALNNTLKIDGVLVSMGLYDYKGNITHVTPLKADVNSSKLLITNSVFAISRADHETLPRLQLAFDKVDKASSGNYWLNLTNDDLPEGYPAIPPSFTYLKGQAARDYWNAARTAWVNGDPVPADPEPEPLDAVIDNVITVNPDTGAIRILTGEAFVAPVMVGAANIDGSDRRGVTLTVA